ncbi:MAG: methyltransferase domain-containing protein [Crenarchaeota archaeon]|nr:methyltransferase domain-containing protein [Thermoproteota archaeon]
MKNAFGLEICEIKDVVKDKKVRETIDCAFFPVLTYLGVSLEKSRKLINDCLYLASNYLCLEEYEAQAHEILEEQKITLKFPQKFSARAKIMYSQIEQYLLPGKVLDYGCGDGRLAEMISINKNQEIELTDVYEHSYIKETGLPFFFFKQGTKAPFANNNFENTLALTVYHHSNNPIETIKDTCRLTKQNGRLIVIESVYGVDGKNLSKSMQRKIESYLSLTFEQQRKVNIFFDHFYNRVLHYSEDLETKVNVPFNFNTPEKWNSIFTDCGLKQECIIHLGLDQPTVPEYHTLHILRKL